MTSLLRRLDRAILLILVSFAAVAWAQERVAFGDDLASMSWLTLLFVVALPAAGGMAATLRKLHNKDTQVRSPALMVATDLLTSIVAGVLVFFGAIKFEADTPTTGGALILAGWSGARVFEWVAQTSWMRGIVPQQDRRIEPRDVGERRRAEDFDR